jgi:hypothetical protein
MQLGKLLATGFASDDTEVPMAGKTAPQADGPDAQAPKDPAAPAPEPEPAASG